MKFDKLIRARYSVRKFNPRPVEEKKILAIMEAARVAPSAKNNQSWRVLVISQGNALEKLKQCTPCHYNAPLAFVFCYDKSQCFVQEASGKISGEVDAAIAGTHMMLEACDLGIGSTWVMNFEPEKIKEFFHVPEGYEVVSLLVCGYPSGDSRISKRHTEYKPIETLFTYNDYALNP